MDSTGGGELGSPPPVLGPALPCEPEVFSLHVVAKHDPKSLVDRRRDVVVLVAEDRLRRGWVQGQRSEERRVGKDHTCRCAPTTARQKTRQPAVANTHRK